MKRSGWWRLGAVMVVVVTGGVIATWARAASAGDGMAGVIVSDDSSGQLRTVNVTGSFDRNNAFFQDIGTNGRTCVTCHDPVAAWSISPATVQARFAASHGRDPIFRNNDGSICEGAQPHTMAEQRAAYGLLLSRGLIRVGMNVPAGAEFIIDSVEDPYGCPAGTSDTSLYRRPLPATNLRFVSAVMWDGRESLASSTIADDLARQANDATRGHAASARDLTAAELQEIVSFETGLFTAQARDDRAGRLSAEYAQGGPAALSRLPFFIGVNDPVGLNPNGTAFTADAFTLFEPWSDLPGEHHDDLIEARRAVARGEALFNTKAMTIAGVGGLNGETFASGVTVPASFSGTCSVCHDTPGAGSHSVKAPLDIGLTEPAVAAYLPIYTLRNLTTGATVRTTDPGRAMVTGKWRDVGKFKGPVLRGLAARAPYFHNGAAASLDEVVEFYDQRFDIGLTAREKSDLVAFLKSL